MIVHRVLILQYTWIIHKWIIYDMYCNAMCYRLYISIYSSLKHQKMFLKQVTTLSRFCPSIFHSIHQQRSHCTPALAPLDFHLSVSGETPCHTTGLVAFLLYRLDPLSRSSHGSSDKGTRPFPWILRALACKQIITEAFNDFPHILVNNSMSLDFHIF